MSQPSTFIQPHRLSTATPGTVYVLTNPAMPGLVKIGKTSGDLVTRLKQLYSTGVPLPFECVFAIEVPDTAFVERRLHSAFGDHRLGSNREFFRLNPERVKAALELAQGVIVTPSEDIADTAEDLRALDAERTRRSNFDFAKVGIGPGAILVSLMDDASTCSVHDSKKVVFRGAVTSISASALIVARENGYSWKTINGTVYWAYEGTPLNELLAATVEVPDVISE